MQDSTYKITAPIVFFAYKRPEHTQKSLESLSLCDGAAESELFIFCDGPKSPEDMKVVGDVRSLVKSRKWCGKVNVIERDKNWGLASSIISGVTELCEKYGRVIVLEDDLIVSKYFLEYMNTALSLYEDNEQVMQISGHMFPVDLRTDTDAVILPFTTSWGWATWQRAWIYFDAEMNGYARLKGEKRLRYSFDLDGSYPYFDMLEAKRIGKVDSWAIVWYLSIFIQEGLTLYPSKTLVQNIGFDGSGTHCGVTDEEPSDIEKNIQVLTFPFSIKKDEISFNKIKKYLKKQDMTLFNKVKEVLGSLIKR